MSNNKSNRTYKPGCERHSELSEELAGRIFVKVLRDFDICEFADIVRNGMLRLFACCEIAEGEEWEVPDNYTMQLVDDYVLFSLCPIRCEVGGSLADYCSTAAMAPIIRESISLRLLDTDEANDILHEMRVGIWKHAVRPREVFGLLHHAGVPIGRH